MATIKEIKEILVNEYDYQKSDFVGKDGRNKNFKQVEAMLKKEQSKAEEVSNDETDELDEFDVGVVDSTQTKFKDGDMITVMAGINGQLVHHSPAGNGVFKFNGFGQRQTMPYKELKAMNNLCRSTLEDGWIIILNKDLINEFNLVEEYKLLLTPKKIDEILNLDKEDLIATIKKLPKSMQTTLIDSAKIKYNAGTLDKASVIKVFEEMYDISFEDNLPLKDIVIN